MSVLSWGKCSIEHTSSKNGTPDSSYEPWDTPKSGTTKITATAGTETTAEEEGGALVDVRTGKNTYQLEFDLFVKKGEARPIVDTDGVIEGEHAFRITPEDPECTGALIERCTLRVEDSFSTEDGALLHYVARCLKPATGNTVKEYVKGKS